MTIFRDILTIFSTRAEPIPHPYRTTEPAKLSSRREPEVKEPDNLVTIAGKDFVQDDNEDGFEAVIWEPVVNTRDASIRQADLKIIDDRGLTATKYRELKRHWAEGKTAATVAKEMKRVRGYGQRTLENYWSAFFASASPINRGRGSDANEPQMTAKGKK